MRIVGILIEIVGSVVIVGGVYVLAPPLAVILGGLLLAGFGRVIRRNGPQ